MGSREQNPLAKVARQRGQSTGEDPGWPWRKDGAQAAGLIRHGGGKRVGETLAPVMDMLTVHK